jgi:hypothetical protein
MIAAIFFARVLASLAFAPIKFSSIEHVNMNNRLSKDENKIMWKGVALMTVFAILDWGLFQWFYNMLQVKH